MLLYSFDRHSRRLNHLPVNVSHIVPVKPAGHMHRKALVLTLWHVPPLRHGFLVHAPVFEVPNPQGKQGSNHIKQCRK